MVRGPGPLSPPHSSAGLLDARLSSYQRNVRAPPPESDHQVHFATPEPADEPHFLIYNLRIYLIKFCGLNEIIHLNGLALYGELVSPQ